MPLSQLEEYQFRNRKAYQMSGWLDDLLGINVGDTLKNAGQSAIDQAKNKVLADVASSTKVQSAAQTVAEQSAASGLAQTILDNKKALMYGGIAIAGLVTILLLKK
jgi:hypothetical protein